MFFKFNYLKLTQNLANYEVIHNMYDQNPGNSITDEKGKYDLERFSASEVSVINSALKTANSTKYPDNLKALGLANEASAVIYKERHILNEIIVLKYKDSDSVLDSLAVAEAYRNKGFYYTGKALNKFMYYIKNAKKEDVILAQKYCQFATEPYFSLTISKLFSSIYRYNYALEFAIRAKSMDYLDAPGIMFNLGDSYRKVDPKLAVKYYRKLMLRPKYRLYRSKFKEELKKSKNISKNGEDFDYIMPVTRNTDFDKAVKKAAKKFLRDIDTQ